MMMMSRAPGSKRNSNQNLLYTLHSSILSTLLAYLPIYILNLSLPRTLRTFLSRRPRPLSWHPPDLDRLMRTRQYPPFATPQLELQPRAADDGDAHLELDPPVGGPVKLVPLVVLELAGHARLGGRRGDVQPADDVGGTGGGGGGGGSGGGSRGIRVRCRVDGGDRRGRVGVRVGGGGRGAGDGAGGGGIGLRQAARELVGRGGRGDKGCFPGVLFGAARLADSEFARDSSIGNLLALLREEERSGAVNWQ